jgi:aspartyl-tRNA(Asn)/glutamyl-tRNA(Gln) amidotransferase subunit C
MPQLTRKDIESVAYLSRLELSEEEKDKLTGHINRLLENFGELAKLDTDDVEPTSHTIPVFNVFRKDEVRASLAVEDVVSNGPQVAENCFVVPRIVET